MMFKWMGGSRQLSQGCTLLPFNVDRGTGDFRGKFDVYPRACPPSGREKILMSGTLFFFGGGVVVYLLQQGGSKAELTFMATETTKTARPQNKLIF